MTYSELTQILSQFKGGQIHQLGITRAAKTKKNCTDIITKSSFLNIRLGCNYDNLTSVKEKRASGELPTENAGLSKNMSWVDAKHGILKNNITGQIYLRVVKFQGNKAKVRWFKNGVEVEKDSLKDVLYASELNGGSNDSPIFNIKIESINYLK